MPVIAHLAPYNPLHSGNTQPLRYSCFVFRSAILVIALNLAPASLPGQDDNRILEQNPSFKKGVTALSDQLPDLAIDPLSTSLEDFKDNPSAQAVIRVRLGEALVRTGRLEKEPSAAHQIGSAALEHLQPIAETGSEQAIFWSAHAHILRGELGEASKLFARLEEASNTTLRDQSHLSRAHILVALGQPDKASKLLTLAFSSLPATRLSHEARLLKVTILIEQKKISEAEKILSAAPNSSDRRQRAHSLYLKAQLTALRSRKDAIQLLESIVEDPQPVQPLIRHSAQVLLAECLYHTERPGEAIESLITLLNTQPRSPLLEAAFHRLHSWSSGDTLRKRLITQLSLWANFTPPDESLPKATTGELIVSPGTAIRTGFALFYHSLSLAQENNPKSNYQAEIRLAWLAKNMIHHPFWSRAILETAKLQIAAQRKEDAILTLTRLEQSSASSVLREEACLLLGRLNFEKGDFNSASSAFLQAHGPTTPNEGQISAINAGISLLRADDDTGFRHLLESLGASEARNALLLERALYQSSLRTEDARPLLENFLQRYPQHARIPEARLAISEEYLRLEPNKASAHRRVSAELEALRDAPLDAKLDLRRLHVHLRIASLTSEWERAITASRKFLRDHKQSYMGTIVQLKLAEAYFHNGDLGEAQARFQKIADSAKDPKLSETALYYAARSALKVGGANSNAESENLLMKIINGEGDLATEARLLLAHSQIDRAPRQALANLQPLLDNSNPAQLDAHMLAADAYREMGSERDLKAALTIYSNALSQPDIPYPLSNRLFWLRGQVYEELEQSQSALEAYYHVVRRENLTDSEEPSEWFYFSRCAFDAVEVLSLGTLPRWEASVEILRLVENSASPWRKEAGRRRLEIQLEHQLYEDQ